MDELETVTRVAFHQVLDAAGEGFGVLAERVAELSPGVVSDPVLVTDATSVSLADLDGDGDLDVVAGSGTAVTWWENESGGKRWTARPIAAEPPAGHPILVTDLDRDGDTDLFAVPATNATVSDIVGWINTAGDGEIPSPVTVSLSPAGHTLRVELINNDTISDTGTWTYRVSVHPPDCAAAPCDRGSSCTPMDCGTDGTDRPSGTGSARILAVGIDRYPGDLPFEPLRFAASDAERIARAFAALRYEPEVRIDGAATREGILGALAREVLVSRPDDDFVFFSGHGFTDRAGNRALVTSGPGSVEVLALSEVEAVLSHHRGRVTVVVDSCLDRRDVELDVEIPTLLLGRTRPAVLVAGAPGTIAIESGELGAGVFSHTLASYLGRLAETPRADGDRLRLRPEDLLVHTSTATRSLAAVLHGVEQEPRLLPGLRADVR